MRTHRARRRGPALAAVLLLAFLAPCVSAQAPVGRDVELDPPDPPGATIVSPAGAFLRAVLVPGWGHASIGSWGRGAFYAAAEGAAVYGFVRSRLRLGEARQRADIREGVLRARAADLGLEGEELAAFVEGDELFEELEGLVQAREDQQEDWLALGIFLVLFSGADAFVSTHLKDFPEPLELEARPAGGGRMEVSVSVGLPR